MDWNTLAVLLAAPAAGSVLGVLVRRLPAGRPVALARSACEHCNTRLAPVDLVPLLSYAVLRGRCRSCRRTIAPFHWHIEAAALLLAAWAALADPDPLRLWTTCLFGWCLLALAWIDWNSWRLPDALTLPLIPAGLLAAWSDDPALATDHAIAAALGFTALAVLALGYRRLRGREGLGGGDAKLLAAIGAWVGLEGLAPVLLGGALLGVAAALAMRLRGRAITGQTPLPFGPCLALAGWVVRLHS